MQLIDGGVNTTQAAACWVANTPNGRMTFTANAGANSIASFAIDHAGNLNLLHAIAATPKHPLDLAVNQEGSLLFSLNSGDQTIGIYGINQNGTLNQYPSIKSVPANATGLVVRKHSNAF